MVLTTLQGVKRHVQKYVIKCKTIIVNKKIFWNVAFSAPQTRLNIVIQNIILTQTTPYLAKRITKIVIFKQQTRGVGPNLCIMFFFLIRNSFIRN